MITRLKDLRRKNDENLQEIEKLRDQNEKNLGENRRLSLRNDQQSQEILTLERRIEHLKCENDLMKRLQPYDTVSCPVCLEKYDTDERQAYALSCPHMVCSECLKPALDLRTPTFIYERPGLSWTARPTTQTERLNNGHIINAQNHPSKRCPVCRQPVTTKLKKICLYS